MKINKSLTGQCDIDILNSWDLMHIMRQIEKNKRQKNNLAKTQAHRANRDIKDNNTFCS